MFKELDIRGKYPEEINEEKMGIMGNTFGRTADNLIVGMDYRKNNTRLLRAFAAGYGKKITLLGNVPTPALAYSSEKYGMMLTASHNPAEYAGLKFFKHKTYISKEEMQKIRTEFEKAGMKKAKQGKIDIDASESIQIVNHYLDSLPEIGDGIFDLCGGAACALKELFPKRIYDAPDPEFKKHSPEPKDDTLTELKKQTTANMKPGFAFDGDGDRLQVCDSGKLIEGDVTAAFICETRLKPHDIAVLSIDCRQEVFDFIDDLGLKAITSKVGDAYVVEKSVQVGALFSAERSGHFTFYNHAPMSDGIYAAAVLSENKCGEFAEFSNQFKNVTLKEEVWFKADFAKLKELMEDKVEKLETIDGIKAKFEEYTLLIRQSTTEPKIRINSEAGDLQKAKRGMIAAKEWLAKVRIK